MNFIVACVRLAIPLLSSLGLQRVSDKVPFNLHAVILPITGKKAPRAGHELYQASVYFGIHL
jgi:hypothetical protein